LTRRPVLILTRRSWLLLTRCSRTRSFRFWLWHDTFQPSISIFFPKFLDHRFPHQTHPAQAFACDTSRRPKEFAFLVLDIGFILLVRKQTGMHHACERRGKVTSNDGQRQLPMGVLHAYLCGEDAMALILERMSKGRCDWYGNSSGCGG
jgi:hypothetical protein